MKITSPQMRYTGLRPGELTSLGGKGGKDHQNAVMAQMAAKALRDGALFYVNGRSVRSIDDVQAIREGRFQ